MTNHTVPAADRSGSPRRPYVLSALSLLLATAGVLGTAGASSAAVTLLYVDRSNPTCSDSGAGSATTPFCTIDRAASVATAGQTVQVAAGTYSEQVILDNSGTSTAPIVFRPAAGATVTVTGKAHGFTIVGRSYVEVRGFRVVGTTGDGISVKSSQSVVLADNEVTGSGAPTSANHAVGIYLESTSGSVISGNKTHHNSDRGIYLNLSNGNTISGNVSYSNAREYTREAAGMHLYRSNDNTIAGNVTYSNEDSGINIYQTSSNNLIVGNLTYNNGDHGVDVSQSAVNNRVVGNTVYKNVTAGLNCEGSSSCVFENNVSVDNGIASPRTHSNIRVDNTSATGSSMNNDVMYLSKADVMAIWNGVNYSTVAALRTATGQEARGLQADPLWRNPGSGDFRLSPGSPAIDSANSGAGGQTTTDLEGTARIDDPATANTGVGPRAYDDRGAYEFIPGSRSNTAPSAVDDSVTTSPDTPVTVNVLANDTDPDGDTLTTVSAGVPAHGTTVINSNGTITYTPSSGYTGSDQFGYAISDGRGGTASAKVSISVTSGGGTTNTPPLAADDTATTPAGTPVAVNVLKNDTDADGDALTVTGSTTPAHGTTTVNSNGTVTYTPASGYTGTDVFDYTVSDGRGGTDTGTVTMTVTPTASQPGPNNVANPGFETDTSGWNLTGSNKEIKLSRVSGGHSGSWSGKLMNTSPDKKRNCYLNDNPNTVTSTQDGTYTVSMWVRADTAGSTFSLRVQELAGTTVVATKSATATLGTTWQQVQLTMTAAASGHALNLNGIVLNSPANTACFYADDASLTLTPPAPPPPSSNNPPVANDDQAATTDGAPVTVNVLANDTDKDGDVLSVTNTTTPAHGSVTIGANGNITYTPNAGYNGSDTFDYTVADGRGGTDLGSVTVADNITPPPPDPNFVGNPGFEADTSGWNTNGGDAGVTLTRVAGGHSGSWAGQLTNTNATTSNCTLNDAPNWMNGTSAGTYTTTLWARADSAGATLRARVREFNNNIAVGSQTSTLTLDTTWQQVTVTYVPAMLGSTLDLNVYTLNTPPGTCFSADDVTMLYSTDLPVNQPPVALDDTASTQQDICGHRGRARQRHRPRRRHRDGGVGRGTVERHGGRQQQRHDHLHPLNRLHRVGLLHLHGHGQQGRHGHRYRDRHGGGRRPEPEPGRQRRLRERAHRLGHRGLVDRRHSGQGRRRARRWLVRPAHQPHDRLRELHAQRLPELGAQQHGGHLRREHLGPVRHRRHGLQAPDPRVQRQHAGGPADHHHVAHRGLAAGHGHLSGGGRRHHARPQCLLDDDATGCLLLRRRRLRRG